MQFRTDQDRLLRAQPHATAGDRVFQFRRAAAGLRYYPTARQTRCLPVA